MPTDNQTTDYRGTTADEIAYRKGFTEGKRVGRISGRDSAIVEASDLIKKMAKARNRSDVNAIKAACAILELSDAE